jgi:DNA-damage-inducible protein J
METKSKDVRLSIRIDSQLRQDASEVFEAMGLDMTTAVRMFLKQSVADNALPFRPQALPRQTIEALDELDHADDFPTYNTIEEMKRAIDAEA